MNLQHLLRFFIILAIVSIFWNLKMYFNRVTSNTFSSRDYRRTLIAFLLVVVLLWGFLLSFPFIKSLSIALFLLVGLLVFAEFSTELFRYIMGAYFRPGAILYFPYKVRYWPSWVIQDKKMVLNQTSVIEFSLVESLFDLNLVMASDIDKNPHPDEGSRTISLRELSNEKKQKLVQEQNIVYPFPKHGERAITESGYFLQQSAVVRVVCEAPGFKPKRQEVKSDIRSLTQNSITFLLIPQKCGTEYVIFKLLDSEGILKGNIKVRCAVVANKNRIIDLFSKSAMVFIMLLGFISMIMLIIDKLKGLITP